MPWSIRAPRVPRRKRSTQYTTKPINSHSATTLQGLSWMVLKRPEMLRKSFIPRFDARVLWCNHPEGRWDRPRDPSQGPGYFRLYNAPGPMATWPRPASFFAASLETREGRDAQASPL